MSGKSAKVIQFPIATRKKIDYQSLNDTIIEPLHNHKANEYWPTVLGVFVGLLYVSLLFLL